MIEPPRTKRWRPGTGIYVIAPLQPSLSEQIHEVQKRVDPKMARYMAPHLTIIGSSGAGPMAPDTTAERLRAALEPIAAMTPPLTLALGAPMRFMQTEILVLPLDPYGPLRVLHEAIRASGLMFAPPRFAFTPHITLNFYRTLTREQRREVLAFRPSEPARFDRIACSLTNDPQPPATLLELPLLGVGAGP